MLMSSEMSHDEVPLSPSLHHSDNVPNIFSQINEFARQESHALKTQSPQSFNKKHVEGNVIRESVISNLQHMLNLSNVAGRLECRAVKSPVLSESNCWSKSEAHFAVRDQENNQIMSGSGMNPAVADGDAAIPPKRQKLSSGCELPEFQRYRILYENDRLKDMKCLNVSHREKLTELFFLQNGGNLMDYFSWKKRPNKLIDCYLFSEKLDDEDIASDMDTSITEYFSVASPNTLGHVIPKQLDCGPSGFCGSPGLTAIGSDVLSHSQSTPDLPQWSTSTPTSFWPKASKEWTQLSSNAQTPSGAVLHLTNDSSVAAASAAYERSQEAIAELARQEAAVMEKITELRKKGLWSVRRIPKAAEPQHARAHWDYVLEEMQWLAADFGQERKAKKAGTRRIARMIVRHFQDQQQKEMKAGREDAQKLRRIASNIAKAVKEFWSNIEKVVQYKQQSRLEEKRRKALDMHLSFIVDQTEKYSTWLTEGLGASLAAGGPSIHSAEANSVTSLPSDGDEDFSPNQDSSDDEETIEKEEEDLDKDKTAEEVAALKKEGEMSFEDFLKTLPEEVLNSAVGVNIGAKAETKDKGEAYLSDAESYLPSENSTDDEETLEEQEKHEKIDHAEELLDLQQEGEIPIEELLRKYQKMYDDEVNDPKASDAEKSDREAKDEDDEEGDEKHLDIGMEFLIDKEGEPDAESGANSTVRKDSKEEDDKCSPSQEINDIAATALSIQPTGYTLETAHVKTSIPFLLKHSLREYQHVGLDWLATMYEQRLNGILADEMGLGKTIQTIALLGFLACEKGIWGPHLIVVPTSVMLNWEMEFKKWCPAFKILTYYGNLKERKSKRQGWTKTNAFHVCITSYKLVIQDHQAFRRKKWKYFILDEAQNIKNFKSQRWQTLLNFHSQRRLLLTGTPLQNNLMELWSLMHFLMPHVFQSHREFKEWFSNPLTGMIEGSMEYNESLVKRLHKVLRPFLLRRLKQDVEKQMPKKYEHVVMCRLSKRQRFLYDDFMSQAKTKETLASGHFMSVINILMQLRKVCNHPNLFDPRPVVSPFYADPVRFSFPSLAARALEKRPLTTLDITDIHPNLCDLEFGMSSLNARRVKELATRRPLIVEIDSMPDPPPRLEPLPDGTQLIVRCPSPELTDDENATGLKMSDGQPSENKRSAMVQSQFEELDVETVSSSWLNDGLQLSMSSSVGTRPHELSLISSKKEHGIVADRESRNPLYLESLEIKRRIARKTRLELIHHYNQRRCNLTPVYGRDLRSAIDCILPPRVDAHRNSSDVGYVHCLNVQKFREGHFRKQSWDRMGHLAELVLDPEFHLRKLEEMLKRFVFVIPPAAAVSPLSLHLSHPSPSAKNLEMVEDFVLRKTFAPKMTCLHNIIRNQMVQFPELRLIQYDCGKLQTMDILLRRLKTEGHRALIFTQMTRMLDVLEAFLNFHGHRYLRLDGTTKVEQRQALMERFNMDQRIFCFILSTRSGGIGVNLTGADTVIFYDSDWNPTMDAQAQDRCHRIGQTRDVHIYRLISEKTVEENILKKANEKRLLGNVAIEGGNFTTAFFKQQTIKDLFEEPSGLESLVGEDNKNNSNDETTATEPGLNEELIEQALCAAEDETDIQAVKVARAEQKAELAEFDETQPWDEVKTDQEIKKEMEDPTSNVEIELALLDKDLTPVERYAVLFMETQLAPVTVEELLKAEEDVGLAKEEWELSHLKALKEEEERRAELEEDEMLYTSLHYTAWKQQPGKKISLDVDDSFGDELPVKRKSKAGRLSNAMKRERMAQNETTLETSLSETWDSSGLGTNFDDSRISSSSISSGGSSLAYADSVGSVPAEPKKPIKRLKCKTSLAIKRKLSGKIGSASAYKTKEKKGLARPLKRGRDETSEIVLANKKQKKNLSNSELSKSAVNAASLMSSVAGAVTAVAAAAAPSLAKPRQSSVTKLLDNKCFMSSHGQRIIVKRVGSEVTAISSSVAPRPAPPPPSASSKELFETNKPIPILEKLGATVMTSPPQLGPSRAPMMLNSKTAAVNFPSHLHVSRLNQIVSSLSLSTLQNASLAQSAPGTIQYILRPSGMVTGGVRTDGVILANSTGGSVQQAAVMQNPQGTSFVLLSQNLGKPNRLITPAVANQANKQSVLILPNAGKQNFIVTQQAGGNRQNFILIPNNSVAQSNFVLTNASTSVAIPSPRVSVQTVGVAQQPGASKGVSSFPLLQTQPMQVTRRIIPPGLAVVSQQSIPVVQSCISNTVPILEKLAMQLGGASTAIVPPQQHRPRIVPSVAMVHPTFKPVDMVLPARVGQLSGSLVPRAAVAPVLAGRICSSSIVTKQSPTSLLANQSSNFMTGRPAGAAILPRMPVAGQPSGIVLTSKPVQPVNVTQFIVNQPRSTISVEKLTQLAVNGQLVLVDGRQTQDLMAGRSLNPQTLGSNKK